MKSDRDYTDVLLKNRNLVILLREYSRGIHKVKMIKGTIIIKKLLIFQISFYLLISLMLGETHTYLSSPHLKYYNHEGFRLTSEFHTSEMRAGLQKIVPEHKDTRAV